MMRARSNVLIAGRLTAVFVATVCLLGDNVAPSLRAQDPALPTATLIPAPGVDFAGGTDSNSPAVWDVVEGRRTLHVLNSIDGHAELSAGRSLLRLQVVDDVAFNGVPPDGGIWMEAVVADDAGTWYGYYHNEMPVDRCASTNKLAPRIGTARSTDRGRTWNDLGTILELSPESARCQTRNQYFVGGVGDFSVMLDAASQYLYLFYTQYVEADGLLGVSVARMPWAERDTPGGAMAVFNAGAWLPARKGESWIHDIATPIFAAQNRWDNDDDVVDVFWGPSIHWNTYLESYVILLNRAVSDGWDQGGIYVAYAPDLAYPKRWSMPTELAAGGEWYPQVLGLAFGEGTDKLAGETARFYMGGRSEHVIQFRKP
jgi:hypothetical protein